MTDSVPVCGSGIVDGWKRDGMGDRRGRTRLARLSGIWRPRIMWLTPLAARRNRRSRTEGPPTKSLSVTAQPFCGSQAVGVKQLLRRRGVALWLGIALLAGFSGCALRVSKPGTAVVEISPGSLPAAYVQRLQEVVRNGRDEMAIEIGLVDAHDALVGAVGERLADSLTAVDPVFNNEMGLIVARRGEYGQAAGFLERGLTGLRSGELLTGARVFDCRVFAPEERVYDAGEPDGPVDRDIWRAYRDHFFGERITQREFVYRVLRRRGRFLPQPSLFPRSLAAVPIEVLNDHFHARRQTDLLSWRRFTHLPIDPGVGTVREMEQALIMNRLVLGMLAGDRELVQQAAAELEKTLLLDGRLGDRQAQNLLQCAYFLLDDQEQLRRFKDPVLEAVLQ